MAKYFFLLKEGGAVHHWLIPAEAVVHFVPSESRVVVVSFEEKELASLPGCGFYLPEVKEG